MEPYRQANKQVKYRTKRRYSGYKAPKYLYQSGSIDCIGWWDNCVKIVENHTASS